MNSDTKLKVYAKVIPMIPLTYVKRLTWNERLGAKLESIRGKRSRPELVEFLAEAGYPATTQTLYKIEKGLVDSIDVELVNAICKILGSSLDKLFPLVPVDEMVVEKLEP